MEEAGEAVSKNRRSNGRQDKLAAAIINEEALLLTSLIPRPCNTPLYSPSPTQPPVRLTRTRFSTPPPPTPWLQYVWQLPHISDHM